MVVLKKGDWCLYRGDRLCKVLKEKYSVHPMVYWADIDKIGYASEEHLTPLPPELYPILSDSIKTGEIND